MPYASKAQQREFHSDPRLRALAAEYDAATQATPGGFAALPERVKPKPKLKPKKRPTPKKSARRHKAARSSRGARMGALEKMLGAVRAARA